MTITDSQLSAWIDGNLEPAEAAAIEAAVAADPTLAERAARLRHLDGLMRDVVPFDDVIPNALLTRLGLAGVAPVIDDEAEPAPVASLAEARARRDAARPAPAPFRMWQIAAQVALIAGIGVIALQFAPDLPGRKGPDGTPDAAYRTLSDASAGAAAGAPAEAPANVIVMFASGTDAATARSIVLAAGGAVVGTPTSAGALRVHAGGDRSDLLTRLRARSEVTMAEPIDAQPQ